MSLKGKEKCEQLKEIRKRIADANGIPYRPKPCTHEGDCLGTCPACDSEVNYLERELEKKRRRGEKVVLKGIAEDMFQETLQSDDSSYDNLDAVPEEGNLHDISEFDRNNKSFIEDAPESMGSIKPPRFEIPSMGRAEPEMDFIVEEPVGYPDDGGDPWPLEPSDVEEYLSDIIDYMEFTADHAGLALDNYYVRCNTKGDKTIITLLGEVYFSKNNNKLKEKHSIKGVIYDKNGRIEQEEVYPINYPFGGFDIFRLKWLGGTMESWMEKRKIRLFIV